jgi:hypothetical protein
MSAGTTLSDDDCGCGKAATSSGGISMAEQVPSPDELGATLDEALSADVQSLPDSGGELSGLELLVDDLEFGGEIEADQGLQNLVSLAERYPGLRITLSFG